MPTSPRLMAVLALLVAALAGCSDMGTKLVLRARGELSAQSLDFGTVAVSGSASRSVTILNSGTADLVGHAALLACTGYQLESGGGPFVIPPGQRLTVTVRFAPAGVGSFPCTLDLGPNVAAVALAGAGALQPPGAQCAVSTAALDFGFAAVGQANPNLRLFTISSVGSAPLLVNVVPSCPEFQVLTGGGEAQLAPGGSITVTVAFNPQSGGRFACAIATGPGCPDVTVTGDGTTVSFVNDLTPIFSNRLCMSCHGWPSGLGGGPLEEMLTRSTNLVNVTSRGYAPTLLVKPYEPDQSVLYGKVEHRPQFGSGMPLNGPQIPLAEREKIRTWILEGAHQN